MTKKKSGFRKLFSRSDKNCCSVEIEEVKKDDANSRNKLNETESKKAN